MASPSVKVFFDGGCRPNPGPIEAAVVIRGVAHVFDDLGHGSSADAEWQALICALEVCRSQGLADVVLVGDALDVIRKSNAALNSGQAAPGRPAAFLALAAGIPGLRIRWIKRGQNLAGIALAARHLR